MIEFLIGFLLGGALLSFAIAALLHYQIQKLD